MQLKSTPIPPEIVNSPDVTRWMQFLRDDLSQINAAILTLQNETKQLRALIDAFNKSKRNEG